jgi:hypothetical protein
MAVAEFCGGDVFHTNEYPGEPPFASTVALPFEVPEQINPV